MDGEKHDEAVDLSAMLDERLVEVFGDFRTFCSLLKIRLKREPGQIVGGEKFFHWEDWHVEQQAIDSLRTGLDIILKGRQVGVSTEELARDFWFALVHRGVNVLVLVQSKDVSHTLFGALQLFVKSLDEVGLMPTTQYSRRGEIVFESTGSSVRVTEAGETERAASKKARSGTYHRLHCTEVAFWGAAATTMAAALESVPEGGEIVIESTPQGAAGVFYDLVVEARAARGRFAFHFFPWYLHREYRLPDLVAADFDAEPRDQYEEKLRDAGCDDAQLAFWRAKVKVLGLDKALEEYPIDADTCFRASGSTWVEQSVVDKLAALLEEPRRRHPIERLCDVPSYEPVPEPTRQRRDVPKVLRRFGEALIYREPEPGQLYVVFGDVAEGVCGDGSAACVMNARTAETAAEWWGDTTEPGDFAYVLDALGRLYGDALVACERNNHGHSTLRVLGHECAYPNVFRDPRDQRPGWNTTPVSRPLLWDDGHHAILAGALWTPSQETLGELRTVVRDRDGKPRARGKGQGSSESSRDDRVVAWFGAFQVRGYAESRRSPPPGNRQRLRQSEMRSGGAF